MSMSDMSEKTGQEIAKLLRELCGYRAKQLKPHGCICPAGAETTCKGDMCPRRPMFTGIR